MSLPAPPPLWTPAQQSWLQAMGYTVFVDGSVDAAPVEPGSARLPEEPSPARLPDAPPRREKAAVEPGPARLPDRPERPQGRAEPGATPSLEETAAPARPTTRRPAVRMPPPLQIALLRASGCNPNDAETQALMASWDLDALRGNAAAKRALWPQLRALRKRNRA